MPFAITCPQCDARYRSPTERPEGKGVECPECGERFRVSAANQEEVSNRPPAAASRARSGPAADEAPRRRPRDDDSDVDLDDTPRSRRGHDDEDDEDDSPRSRKGRVDEEKPQRDRDDVRGRGRRSPDRDTAPYPTSLTIAGVYWIIYFLLALGGVTLGFLVILAMRRPPGAGFPVESIFFAVFFVAIAIVFLIAGIRSLRGTTKSPGTFGVASIVMGLIQPIQIAVYFSARSRLETEVLYAAAGAQVLLGLILLAAGILALVSGGRYRAWRAAQGLAKPNRRTGDIEDDDSLPPRARKSRAEEDDGDRDDEFDGDDMNPRRKGKGKVLALVGALAVLPFAVAGVGAYVLFLDRTPSAAHKIRPPRDLPRDMFANMPTDKHEVVFCDFDLARELGCASMPLANDIEQALPKGADIRAADMRYACLWKPSFAYSAYLNQPDVLTLELAAPVDGKAVAARCKLEPMTGGPANTFTDADKLTACVLAQPRPTRLVFVRYKLAQNTLDRKKMAEIANRPAGAVQLHALLDSALADASGYPFISGYGIAHSAKGEPRINLTGSLVGPDSMSETLDVTEFFDLYQAKNATRKDTRKKGASDYGKWTRENRIFEWNRVPAKQ